MKNIQTFVAPKYATADYTLVEDGIHEHQGEFVVSLTFEQEPEFEEGDSAANISQYPLEDILDKFLVHVSDSYDDLNTADSPTCHLEFAADDLERARSIRGLVDQHVHNREVPSTDPTIPPAIELVIESAV